MKKTLLILAALGFGIYIGFKGLYSLAWRTALVLSIASPALMGGYLAYAINVLHWQLATLWVMPPLILLSLVVGHREFSWSEPLIKK